MPCPVLPGEFFQKKNEGVGTHLLHESNLLFRAGAKTFERISDSQNIVEDRWVLLRRR
ncbi:hypothetical protein D3C71_2228320 [compost metagenome]